MTTDPDPARAERLAALQARRTGTPTTSRRHPAQTSRIAAAGISVSTMFGLVAVMGLARADAGEAEAAPLPAAATQSVVVVHHLPAPAAPGSPAPGVAVPGTTPTATAPPVALTAPRVTVATAPPATPTKATTHGSR